MVKKFINIFMTIVALQSFSCHGAMTIGRIIQLIIVDEMTEQAPLYYASEKQSYTNGGITFNYPVDLFQISPVIKIGIEPNGVTPSDSAYTAEITSNSATSTTVTIKVLTTTSSVVSIAEAATDEVTVHLLATEDPVLEV